jgi:hypothetical protein
MDAGERRDAPALRLGARHEQAHGRPVGLTGRARGGDLAVRLVHGRQGSDLLQRCVGAGTLVVGHADRASLEVETVDGHDLLAQARARGDGALMAAERPAVHLLATDAVLIRESFGSLATVELDRIHALEQPRVGIHGRQHVAAFLDDVRHVHPVLDGGDAEVRHAVEPTRDEHVSQPALDLHRRDVHGHHRRGAGALHAETDHAVREAGEERDGRPGVGLLAHHLDGPEDHPVDVAGRDAGTPEDLMQDHDGQIVRANLPEGTTLGVRLPEGRANVSDEDDLTKLGHDGRACTAR